MKKFFLLSHFLPVSVSSPAYAGFISGTQLLVDRKSVALKGRQGMPLSFTSGYKLKKLLLVLLIGGMSLIANWAQANQLTTYKINDAISSTKCSIVCGVLKGEFTFDYTASRFSSWDIYDGGFHFSSTTGDGIHYNYDGITYENNTRLVQFAHYKGELARYKGYLAYLDLWTPMRSRTLNADVYQYTGEFGGEGHYYDSSGNSLSIVTHKVPEPSTVILFALGVGGLLLRRRKASR